VDATRQLLLEERSGNYEGMAPTRSFLLVFHGQDVTENKKEGPGSRKIIQYEGKTISIGF
jgi:hypothetical protein